MACGCKGKTNNNGTWVYKAPDGTETEKRTEVEALALRVRAGRVGDVFKR